MSEITDLEPHAVLTPPGPRAGTELLELDRPECLRRLAATQVGRIAVSVPDWPQPMIRPVNYHFDQATQSVLIRSGPGSKLHAILHCAQAAFEIDGTDSLGRVGWSVIAHGVTEEITNPAELRRVEGLGLEPWAPGEKGHWLRVRVKALSGRLIASASGG
jgi:nitroimidazol reductase NimA-like FMN-containing flavoprotein (pyridoxamine 5'-phosphate oxidase superfamily)